MWVLMYVFSYSVSPAATNDSAEWRPLPLRTNVPIVMRSGDPLLVGPCRRTVEQVRLPPCMIWFQSIATFYGAKSRHHPFKIRC